MSDRKKRVAPVITAITNAIPMPERKNNRGSKQIYPFEQLTEVGQSFGIKNKTAAQITSIVSNYNRAGFEDVVDAKGKPVMVKVPAKDEHGVEKMVPGTEPERKRVRKFYAVDVDPSTDPDGASVRVFREI